MQRYRKIARDLTLLLGLTLALLVPFSDKAFHIDDEVTLKLACALQQQLPWHTFTRDFSLHGYTAPYLKSTHPLLVPLYTKLIIQIAGRHEQALHLAFMLFPLLAVTAMYFLGRRFSPYPGSAALLLLGCPAFLVMAHGLMNDVPALAFLTATLAAGCYGIDTGRRGLIILAGAALTLASLVSYQMLYLIPLLIAYCLLQRRPLTAAMPAIIPPLIVLAVTASLESLACGKPQIILAFQDIYFDLGFTPLGQVARNLFSNAIYIGGTTILAPALGIVLWRGLAWRRAAIAAPIIIVTLFFLVVSPAAGLGNALLITLFLAAGAIVIITGIAYLRSDDRDRAFMAVMLLGILVINTGLLPFNAVRHILPVMPVVILMFITALNTHFSPRAARIILVSTVVLTLVTGLVVAKADYDLANAYRTFAASFSRDHAGQPVWFTGEWGFRYYLEEAGFRYVTRAGAQPQPGQLVLVPQLPCPVFEKELYARLIPLQEYTLVASGPLQTMSFSSQAGFYSFWGGRLPLPYAINRGEFDRITLYRLPE